MNKKFINKNIRNIIIIILCGAYIFINFLGYIQRNRIHAINTEEETEKYYQKIYTYYNNVIPEMRIVHGGKIVDLSDNRNKLLICIQHGKDIDNNYINQLREKVNISVCDIVVYILSNSISDGIKSDLLDNNNIKLFREYFDLGNAKYFTILIDKNNRVKYYRVGSVPSIEKMMLLVKRYEYEI